MSINTPVVTDQRPVQMCPFCRFYGHGHEQAPAAYSPAGDTMDYRICGIPVCSACYWLTEVGDLDCEVIEYLMEHPVEIEPEVHAAIERAYNRFFPPEEQAAS